MKSSFAFAFWLSGAREKDFQTKPVVKIFQLRV